MKIVFAAVLLAASVSLQAANAPVTVVVISNQADRADAARLQRLVENAVSSTSPIVVTIQYYGAANAIVLPPLEIRKGSHNQLVFAAFTITDAAGKVLHSEWLPYDALTDRLTQLHKAANVIAQRVRTSNVRVGA